MTNPGYMQYVEQGHTNSTLKVHVANANGLPACGQVIKSPIRGYGWWYDMKAGSWKQIVPAPHNGPATCGKCR